MKQLQSSPRYYLLYLPLLASYLFGSNPVVSYLIAWAGSFFIFYVSFTNKVKPTSADLPLSEKIMKPLFLTQLIFAGYMCCTSIFYFLDQMGYEYLSKVPDKPVFMENVAQVAACQQYYLIGHAALAHGLLYFYKSGIKSDYKIQVANWPLFFLRVVLICTPLAFMFSRVGSLSVLGNSLEGLALVAATIAFALSIPMRQKPAMIISGIIYGVKLMQALSSGYKEPVIVSVLMLGLFLYPFYKRTITMVFVPVLLFLFAVLPTYVNTFRSQSWSEGQDAESAKAAALEKVREDMNGDNLAETNWAFLTDRISEIGMFVKYKESIEEKGQYYNLQIISQSFMALIPRILWPDKPITEYIVMQRVLDNGIVSENSLVSAKPQYIVDGYLSGGVIGIWIALFLYGSIAQVLCNTAEKLFGGYFFGTTFIYTGMLPVLWRGNCFEFVFNSVFYSSLGLFVLFFIFKSTGILQEKKSGVPALQV